MSKCPRADTQDCHQRAFYSGPARNSAASEKFLLRRDLVFRPSAPIWGGGTHEDDDHSFTFNGQPAYGFCRRRPAFTLCGAARIRGQTRRAERPRHPHRLPPIKWHTPSPSGSSLAQSSLGFTGNLDAIDPVTGKTSVVGPTGLGDSSTLTSPCGPDSANWIGLRRTLLRHRLCEQLVLPFDPKTAKTKLIGSMGIPAIPFSENPDGSANVFGASLFSARGKFYAYFAT